MNAIRMLRVYFYDFIIITLHIFKFRNFFLSLSFKVSEDVSCLAPSILIVLICFYIHYLSHQKK